jgi:hypothetical protein
MPFPHIWSVITWRLGSGLEIQLVSTLPLVVFFMSEPGRGFSKSRARELKLRMRTDVPERTLGEVHLSAHRNWAHQKLAIGIAGSGS